MLESTTIQSTQKYIQTVVQVLEYICTQIQGHILTTIGYNQTNTGDIYHYRNSKCHKQPTRKHYCSQMKSVKLQLILNSHKVTNIE